MRVLAWMMVAGCGSPPEPKHEVTHPSTATPDTTPPDSTAEPTDSADSAGDTATEPTPTATGDASGTWTGPCSGVADGTFWGFATVLDLDDDQGALSGSMVQYQYYASTTSTSYSAYYYSVRGTRFGDAVTLKPRSTGGDFDRIQFDLTLDGDTLDGTVTWGPPYAKVLPCALVR